MENTGYAHEGSDEPKATRPGAWGELERLDYTIGGLTERFDELTGRLGCVQRQNNIVDTTLAEARPLDVVEARSQLTVRLANAADRIGRLAAQVQDAYDRLEV